MTALKSKIAAYERLNAELVDSIKHLKKHVISQKDVQIKEKDIQISELKTERSKLKERESKFKEIELELRDKIAILEALHFGPKSEKWTKEDERQAKLFNEAEDGAFNQNDPEKIESATETIEVGAHTKRKKKRNQGRTAIDESIPREIVEQDIPEDEKTCACGAEMTCIGYDSNTRVKIIPAKVSAVEERKMKYACRSCEGTEREDEKGVITAEGIKHLIPRSIADESLLAWSIMEKFEFALPLYRQEKRLAHIGIKIPRATLAGQHIKTAEVCRPLYELIKKMILSGPVINADETRLQVLNESGRKAQDQSWAWVFLGGPPDKKLVYFTYDPGRSSKVPHQFLSEYEGYLQTDDWGAYHTALKKIRKEAPDRGISHVLCWQHARSRFMDAWKTGKSQEAAKAIKFIKQLFELEDLRKDYSKKGFLKQRKNKAGLIFEDFKPWLEDLYSQTPPKGLLGKAAHYTLDNWEQLVLYVDSFYLTPSNNLAENAIRPFVVGRKNWLFSCSPAGANGSMILYSLIESAKLNKLVPYDYLYHIFRKLPYAVTQEDLEKLLPCHLTQDEIKIQDEAMTPA